MSWFFNGLTEEFSPLCVCLTPSLFHTHTKLLNDLQTGWYPFILNAWYPVTMIENLALTFFYVFWQMLRLNVSPETLQMWRKGGERKFSIAHEFLKPLDGC